MNEDRNIRAALDRNRAALDANDFEAEHEIYRDDAVLEYPQLGERIRGRRNIQGSCFAQPNQEASFGKNGYTPLLVIPDCQLGSPDRPYIRCGKEQQQ